MKRSERVFAHAARDKAGKKIPLVSVEGTARECGLRLGTLWTKPLRDIWARGPSYGPLIPWWEKAAAERRLVDRIAPHLAEIVEGMMEGAGLLSGRLVPAGGRGPIRDACTSFSVHGRMTQDGTPLSGQNKDTSPDRVNRYRVLRLKPSDGPGFFVLTYPCEIAGYGMSTTGMTLFRNNLYVKPASSRGLPVDLFFLLGLCFRRVDDVVDLACRHGILGTGNSLFTDALGNAAAIEHVAGVVSIVRSRTGVLVHANHPEARGMKKFLVYPEPGYSGSRLRAERLRKRLREEAGRLTVPGLFRCLSDHEGYPRGVCRHRGAFREGQEGALETTAAFVADPAGQRLLVTRGQPCRNRPAVYVF